MNTNVPSNGISDEFLSSFRMAKVFSDTATQPITSLDFSDCGDYCVVGSETHESIHLYDCVLGKSRKQVFSKKYGVGPLCATHSKSNVIYASTKGEPTVRYLSLHDNAYLRYFRGHRSKIVALEMSPIDDGFISGSVDDTVRLWDLRSPQCLGVMNVTGIPLIAIDPQGLVFAIALGSRHLRLFDMKNYEKGPFAMFEIVDPNSPSLSSSMSDAPAASNYWTRMKFSPDGKDLLINTRSGLVLIIDAFEGHVRQILHPAKSNQNYHQPSTSSNKSVLIDGAGIEASFTPDASHVICGSMDGKIYGWNLETGKIITELEGHPSPPRLVQFNPKYSMMVSACTSVVGA